MTTTEVHQLAESRREYTAGFFTDIEQEFAPPGLNEDIVRFISAKKQEPEWMTEWRLKAYRHWQTMAHPGWPFFPYGYDKPDYQAISYYAAPKARPKSLDDIDPAIRETYDKLGIPLEEQKVLAGVEGAATSVAEARSGTSRVAVDAVFDSVSVATTFKEELRKAGVIFCSMSEAILEHPELVKQYLGTVVPYSDNFFATLNSAVFSDGSFVYVPKGVKCPMELSTYFRINAA